MAGNVKKGELSVTNRNVSTKLYYHAIRNHPHLRQKETGTELLYAKSCVLHVNRCLPSMWSLALLSFAELCYLGIILSHLKLHASYGVVSCLTTAGGAEHALICSQIYVDLKTVSKAHKMFLRQLNLYRYPAVPWSCTAVVFSCFCSSANLVQLHFHVPCIQPVYQR